MKRIKEKLCSRTGASISFALFLFLVCAVLSSVIIVAATASAGRMAGMAEMDQRYYGVTSASVLLKDLLDNQTVSVVKVTESWSTTTYTDGVAGTPVVDRDETGAKLPEVKNYLVTGQNAAQALNAFETAGGIPAGWDESTVQKENICNDAAYRYNQNMTIPTDNPRTLTLASTDIKTALGLGDGDKDPLAVTIKETLDNTGKLTFTVYNAEGDQFKQELVFSADVSQRTETKAVKNDPANYSTTDVTTGEGESAVTTTHYSYTVTTKTTKIEITTLTWALDSMKTLSSPAAE